jgi:hypothetical protein
MKSLTFSILAFPLGILIFGSSVFAETSIPPGTVLPARLNSTLNSQKTRLGQSVTARIMQDVPLPAGEKIKAGSRLVGRITGVRDEQSGQPSQISIRFDKLEFGHHSLPVTTSLRAIASWMDVHDAQIPPTGPDRGTPAAWATHTLIGGEVAYGEGGPVASGIDVVGKALADGVLVTPRPNPAAGCRGDNGNAAPQAFWVFSSDACGVYGIPNLCITDAGRTNPNGEITLMAENGKLLIRGGAGMLLRVMSSGQQ